MTDTAKEAGMRVNAGTLEAAKQITDAAAAEMRRERPGTGFHYDILHKHIAVALSAAQPPVSGGVVEALRTIIEHEDKSVAVVKAMTDGVYEPPDLPWMPQARAALAQAQAQAQEWPDISTAPLGDDDFYLVC